MSSFRFLSGRTSSEVVMDNGVVSGFKKLFPYLTPNQLYDPARSSLMAAISNLGNYAFSAYDEPTVAGFEEYTSCDTVIRHLQWNWVHHAMAGVLKIELRNAEGLKDSDGLFQGHSDPYVVFTAGGSCAKSATVYDSPNPVWNSIHYLPLRKRLLEPDSDSQLTVAVLDKDTRSGIGAILNGLDRDDHLGTAHLDLEELKKPGVHTLELDLKHRSTAESSSEGKIRFTVKFLSVKEALDELNFGEQSDIWMESVDTNDEETNWKNITDMTDLGFIATNPVAYIDAKETGTQAWIHVNADAKVVVVAFRGTEMNRLKDILSDIKFLPEGLSGTSKSSSYAMKPSSQFLDRNIKLHRGFKQAYDSIRESVMRVVYDLTGWDEDWTVCVCGHSLGGALATLCAFEFSNRKLPKNAGGWRSVLNPLSMLKPFRVSSENNSVAAGPKVGMMNFGAPRVGNSNFARNYNASVSESLRVVNSTDLVHFLPPILYSHTKYEVILHMNGMVQIEGKNFQSGNYSQQVLDAMDEEAEGGRRIQERAFTGISVKTHMQPYYYEIVKAAVDKFFQKEVKMRGQRECAENSQTGSPQ